MVRNGRHPRGPRIPVWIHTLDHEPAHVHIVGPGQATIKIDVSDLQSVQNHLASGLDVWKNAYEKLSHEHHQQAGSGKVSSCSVCLREHEFPVSELVPAAILP